MGGESTYETHLDSNGSSVSTVFKVACGGGEEETPTPTSEPEGVPTVIIDSPPSGSQTAVGEEVFIQSTSSDEVGVLRVVLEVDGVQVGSDASADPNGQVSFSLLQSWVPQSTGDHIVTVTAFRADGTASTPATISVTVLATVAEVQATIPPPPPPSSSGGGR